MNGEDQNLSTSQPVAIDPERQIRAKAYARIQRRMFVLDLVIGGLYVIAWLVLGLSISLRNALSSAIESEWLLVAAFGAVMGLGFFLLDLPLSYYSEYILPHRFELSNQTLGGWVGDQFKSILISALLGLVLLEIVYAVLRAAPDTWWLWVAGIMLLFNVILSNLAPVLIMPLFNKFIPLGDEYADLTARLLRLAERTHTRVQGVFKFDLSRRTKAANAALTGLGNTRRIILGDTLLKEFTPDEIETVLAHELGHHVHKDIPLLIGVNAVMTLLGLYLASLGLSWGASFLGVSVADIAALPVLLVVMGLFGLVTMPLSNTLTRWRESLADDYALEITKNGSAFAAALTRLANQNLAETDPEPWLEFLLYSHPALQKRIKKAESYTPF